MNYALLVSDLQGVYHVQHELQTPVTLPKPNIAVSAFKRMITRLVKLLQHH
jgi:hypothetical protein